MVHMAQDPPLDQAVTEAMLRVFNKVVLNHRMVREYRGERLTMVEAQICLLVSLAGEITPSEVAAISGVTRSAVSQVLGRLRTRGYVETQRSPDDGRSHKVRLTASGRHAAQGVQDMFDDMRSRVYVADDSELQAMLGLFERVEEYLDSVLTT
jgi:DNA-binding MarR family transcriptional regulator